MELIIKYKIDAHLLKIEKIIIGLSAGSINMSNLSICSKDEDFDETVTYDGMKMLSFSFEPHFDETRRDVLNDLLEISHNNLIYACKDDAFIISYGNDISFFGEIYELRDGIIEKI